MSDDLIKMKGNMERIAQMKEKFRPRGTSQHTYITCLPLLIALKAGAAANRVGTGLLGCDHRCSECIFDGEQSKEKDISNLIKTVELIDD